MSTEVTTVPEVEEKATPRLGVLLGNYVNRGVVSDFSQWGFIKKLGMVQKTPDKYVREKIIQGKAVKYVDYVYAQRVLNFIFNFKVSNRLVKDEMRSYTKKSKKGYDMQVVEWTVVMEYTFIHPDDGTQIVRTVNGSHKMYMNDAIQDGMCQQAAISKSWTAVAKTFGIGAGLDDDSLSTYENEVDTEPQYSHTPTVKADQPATPVAKSFIPKATY